MLPIQVPSQNADASSAILIVSEKILKEFNLTPLVRVAHISARADDPIWMLTAPIPATEFAVKKSGIKLEDIGLVEINEAFANVTMYAIDKLGLDPKKVNPNGGAIALGHPLGCTGSKLSVQLFNEMKRRKQKYGMVTMCVGAGQGAAGIFEIL